MEVCLLATVLFEVGQGVRDQFVHSSLLPIRLFDDLHDHRSIPKCPLL